MVNPKKEIVEALSLGYDNLVIPALKYLSGKLILH